MTPQQRKAIQEIFDAILEEKINLSSESSIELDFDRFCPISSKTLETLKKKGVIKSYDCYKLGAVKGTTIEFIPKTIAQYAEWSR
jgi:hypothetical protein